MKSVGDKVTFYTPATHTGTVQAFVKAGHHRGDLVSTFLRGREDDIEIRLGSEAIMGEDSYLILTNGSCKNCRKRLYHIPASKIKGHDTGTSNQEAESRSEKVG